MNCSGSRDKDSIYLNHPISSIKKKNNYLHIKVTKFNELKDPEIPAK